jgi:pre-mRNA-processing factor 17
MTAPVLGPANPFDTTLKNQNTIAGHVEEHAIDGHAFRSQHKSFVHLGYAFDPSSSAGAGGVGGGGGGVGIVGDLERAVALDFATVDGQKGPSKADRRAAKRKRVRRKGEQQLDVVDGEDAYEGPWAAYDEEGADGEEDEEDEESKEGWRVEKRRREEEVAKAKERRKTAGEEKSIFHGPSFSFLLPSDLDCPFRRTGRRQGADKTRSLSLSLSPPPVCLFVRQARA